MEVKKKLGEICLIERGLEGADFYIRSDTGEVMRKSDNPADIGIRVTQEGLDIFNPDFLYYYFMHIHINTSLYKTKTPSLRLYREWEVDYNDETE